MLARVPSPSRDNFDSVVLFGFFSIRNRPDPADGAAHHFAPIFLAPSVTPREKYAGYKSLITIDFGVVIQSEIAVDSLTT